MPNTIALMAKFAGMLDEVYAVESRTSILDASADVIRAGNSVNEIKIPKMSMSGLANHERNGNYSDGSVNITYESVKFNYDRSRKFTVDIMDDEETAGVAFGQLSSQFVRTKVVPELDAFRFATYASNAGIQSKNMEAAITDGTVALSEIVSGMVACDEADVPVDGRVLFITPTLYTLVNAVDTYKSKEILNGFSKIVTVPQNRFYTAIDLLDGRTGGEVEGGYKKADSAKNINFMIIQSDSVIQFTKHTVNKIVKPEDNQSGDGWMFFYRAYGLSDVYENKLKGIYLNASNT